MQILLWQAKSILIFLFEYAFTRTADSVIGMEISTEKRLFINHLQDI